AHRPRAIRPGSMRLRRLGALEWWRTEGPWREAEASAGRGQLRPQAVGPPLSVGIVGVVPERLHELVIGLLVLPLLDQPEPLGVGQPGVERARHPALGVVGLGAGELDPDGVGDLPGELLDEAEELVPLAEDLL